MSTKSKILYRAPAGALPLFLAYLGTIPAANWAITEFGVVSVGFGLVAPAAVYFAGAPLVLRDWLREVGGHGVTVTAILLGAGASYVVADARLATASAVAFLVSEALDYGVYEPLRKASPLSAVAASNTVGLAADSILFLALAFGSMQYLPGQLIGKAWATVLALAVIGVRRRGRAR